MSRKILSKRMENVAKKRANGTIKAQLMSTVLNSCLLDIKEMATELFMASSLLSRSHILTSTYLTSDIVLILTFHTVLT